MRRSIDRLAIFGGEPAFDRKVHVGQPNVGDRAFLMQRIEDILDTRWFTNYGANVRELESSIASYLDVRHCISVCNATVGLEIAVRALGMKGEVIVPSLTFVATAHALQWQQVKPVFCDIDPATHTLDPAVVEQLITDRTTGILGVHLWGRPCAIDALQEIADRRGLRLLFDAAHAFGCAHRGQMIGGFGDAEVFSFHATKFFNTFEGGAITTNDSTLADKLRLMTNFGFAGYDNVVHIGTNGKMCEIAAAMGLASMRSLDEFVATNRRNHRCYRERLGKTPGITLLDYDSSQAANYQYVVAEYEAAPGGLSRDELVNALWAENVMARKYFWPGCHRMEPYRSLYPESIARLTHTDAVASRLLVLPTNTGVSLADIDTICELVDLLATSGSAIHERMRHRSTSM